MKRTEDSLGELWDKMKHTNIHIIGVPEGEDRRLDFSSLFEELIAENFPNMGMETVNQAQEAQRVPERINPRRITPR